jgi:heme o synthase
VSNRTANITWAEYLKAKVDDFKLLVKFRLTMFVVFSAVMAFMVTVGSVVEWLPMLVLATGGFFIAAAANALNEVIEKDFDKMMDRTSNRPIAAGRMTVSEGVLIAGFLTLAGLVLLAFFNPLTSLLGALAIVSYAFIYTPLKRYSTIAIPVGAIPGALPVLIGSVAYSGEITSIAMILFGIQFLWQFPHFLAIGWLGFNDYSRAGFKLVPTSEGRPDPSAGTQSLIYSLLILPLLYVAFHLDYLSIFGLVICIGLTLYYAWLGYGLFKQRDNESAKKLMFMSFAYLPLVLIVFLIQIFL